MTRKIRRFLFFGDGVDFSCLETRQIKRCLVLHRTHVAINTLKLTKLKMLENADLEYTEQKNRLGEK